MNKPLKQREELYLDLEALHSIEPMDEYEIIEVIDLKVETKRVIDKIETLFVLSEN